MTDELRERVAILLFRLHAPDLYDDDDSFDELEPADIAMYRSWADAVLSLPHPGDVLPNGWVAPKVFTDKMFGAMAGVKLNGGSRQESWEAMRAAAIREKDDQ